MPTLSPSIDRIGAALRALRQTHGRGTEGDVVALGAKCLHSLVSQLAEDGVAREDLQPLVDLEAQLRQSMAKASGEGIANRRKRQPPSDRLLARGAAVIDLRFRGRRGGSDRHAPVVKCRRSGPGAGR